MVYSVIKSALANLEPIRAYQVPSSKPSGPTRQSTPQRTSETGDKPLWR